jgi:geranylgeranyl pyrophosphate synthase
MPADEEAKIDEVTHIFRDIGIHDIAAAERDKFRDKAFGHLEEVQVAEEEKGLLHEMTDLVITREH